jgi:hypothetical protein
MAKAWSWGAAAVLAVHFLWFGLIYTQAHWGWMMPAVVVMLLVVMNIAGFAAFLTAWRAPRHRMLLGMTMAPLSAALAVASNLLVEASGLHVDFAGFRGNVGLFAISLAYGIFVSAVGAGMGAWIASRRVLAVTPAPAPPALTPGIPGAELPAMQISPPPTADLPQIRSN